MDRIRSGENSNSSARDGAYSQSSTRDASDVDYHPGSSLINSRRQLFEGASSSTSRLKNFVLENMIIEKQIINKQNILKQLGEFLVMMQERKMAHNDFKAKNILIYNDLSTIKICDFDLGNRNTMDNRRDLQKFRYLVVQLVFDLDYKTAWYKYDKYAMQMQYHPILTSQDVLQIRELCNHFKV